MLSHFGATGDHLFGLQDDGLRLLSSQNTEPLPERLLSRVTAYLDAELNDSNSDSTTLAKKNIPVGDRALSTVYDTPPFESVILYGFKRGRLIVTGVAALTPANGSYKADDPEVLYAISAALLATGDVVSKNVVQ